MKYINILYTICFQSKVLKLSISSTRQIMTFRTLNLTAKPKINFTGKDKNRKLFYNKRQHYCVYALRRFQPKIELKKNGPTRVKVL